MYRAIYSYNGSSNNEQNSLVFTGGDVIKVINSEGGKEGWWQGEKDGNVGWFPASYVKAIDKDSPVTPNNELPAGWRALETPEGKKYYLNTINNTTTWEYPIFPATLPLPTVDLLMNGNAAIERSLSVDSTGASPPNSPLMGKSKANGSKPQQPKYRVINGICFPTTKEQELLHPNKYSYCDYFWHDKEDSKHGYESGFNVILQKIAKGKQMSKEMADFFKARETVEYQYAKGLTALANETMAMAEEGTLSETWKTVKESMLYEAKLHKELANRLRTSVEKPLVTYKDSGKKESKQMDAKMVELRKQCYLRFQALEKSKQQMEEKQRDLEAKLQSPKKNEEEIVKARRKSTKQREDTGQMVNAYNDAKNRWFEEMVTQTLVLEKQEVDRIELIKKHLMKYCNLVQDVNNKSKEACDDIKQKIRATDPAKDRELWVRGHKTGSVRPVDIPK